MMTWQFKHPQMTRAHLGYLPDFLNEADPRPAVEQLDSGYRAMGGWKPFGGFTLVPNGLAYPGDPPMKLLAETTLREETIRLYECDWVAVVQPDGSFAVARMS